MRFSSAMDAYGAFARAENILHIPIITSRGEHAYKGFHVQNVSTPTPAASRTGCDHSRRRILVSAELPRLAQRH